MAEGYPDFLQESRKDPDAREVLELNSGVTESVDPKDKQNSQKNRLNLQEAVTLADKREQLESGIDRTLSWIERKIAIENPQDLLDAVKNFMLKQISTEYPIDLQLEWMYYFADQFFTNDGQFNDYNDHERVSAELINRTVERFSNPGGIVIRGTSMRYSYIQGQSKTFDAWLWRNRPGEFMKIFGKISND